MEICRFDREETRSAPYHACDPSPATLNSSEEAKGYAIIHRPDDGGIAEL